MHTYIYIYICVCVCVKNPSMGNAICINHSAANLITCGKISLKANVAIDEGNGRNEI